MVRCEWAQAQLLDHLYGLVEGEERVRLETHLDACDACRLALQQSEGHRQLLSAASKLPFAEVRFEAPSAVPMAHSETLPGQSVPTDPKMPVIPRWGHRVQWTRYAVAASLFILVGVAASAPLGSYLSGRMKLNGVAVEADRKADHIRADADEKFGKALAVNARRGNELQAAAKSIREQRDKAAGGVHDSAWAESIYLTAIGSNTFESGGRNEVAIQTRNLKGEAVEADIYPQLVDKHNKVLCPTEQLAIQKTDNAKGEYRIGFPRDLGLTPDQEIYLEINAVAVGGRQAQLRQWMHLSAPSYITDLRTDKPAYQPGDIIYFRSLTLERGTLRPANVDLDVAFTLLDPNRKPVLTMRGAAELEIPENNKETVNGPDRKPIRGVAAGAIPIPNPEMRDLAMNGGKESKDAKEGDKIAGHPAKPGEGKANAGFGGGLPSNLLPGEYTLVVSEANNHFPPERRKIFIGRLQQPLLVKELEFGAKSYVPGEVVTARLRGEYADKKKAAKARIAWAAMTIDGKEIPLHGKEADPSCALNADDQGGYCLRFKLPPEIKHGEACLAVRLAEGKVEETIFKSIPLVLNRIDLQFYPEGGDLIAGLPNRVYFEARTPQNKRADFIGHLVDDTGDEVRGSDGNPISVRTMSDPADPMGNLGAGQFAFTPDFGRTYSVRLTRPGPAVEGRLPEVKSGGVMMHIAKTVTSEKDPIQVELRSVHPTHVTFGPASVAVNKTGIQRSLLIGAYCRGRLLAVKSVELLDGEKTTVELRPEAGVGGVFRVTVFEEVRGGSQTDQRLIPLAERLMYRTPTEQLIVTCTPERETYGPGEKVTAHFQAFDENEKAKAAVLMVAVVDKGLLQAANEKTRRTAPTHFYLAHEIRQPEDLEYADFLLTNHPQARVALDLLLGTQGWRRFAEQNDTDGFIKEYREDAERLLATTGRAPIRADNYGDAEKASSSRIEASLEPIETAYAASIKPIQSELESLEIQNDELAGGLAITQRELAKLARIRADAENALAEYQRQWMAFLILATGIALLAVGGVSLLTALLRRQGALPYFATAAACAICFAIGLGALGDGLPFGNAPGGDQPFVHDVEDAVETKQPLANLGKPDLPPGGEIEVRPGQPAKPRDPAVPEGPISDGNGGKGEGQAKFDAAMAKKQMHDIDRPPTDDPSKGGAESLETWKARAVEFLRRQDELARFNQPLMTEGESKLKEKGDAHPSAGNYYGGPRSPGGIAPAPPAGKPNPIAKYPPGEPKPGYAWPPERPYIGPNPPMPMPPPSVTADKGKDSADGGKRDGARRFYVREYRHENRLRSPGLPDLTETVYWHPALVMPDGQIVVEFDLNDVGRSYEILMMGHTVDGRLGAASTTIVVGKPAK